MRQSSLLRTLGLALLIFGVSLTVIVILSLFFEGNGAFPFTHPGFVLVGVLLFAIGVGLVRRYDYSQSESDLDFENSVVLQDEVEAQFLSQSLDEEQIPYYIVTNHSSAYANLFEMGGWGIVRSPRKFHEQIRMAIRALREG